MEQLQLAVGITGHQDLGSSSSKAWIRECLLEQVAGLNKAVGLTSLAIGADQFFAELLLEKGILFQAIIPCRNYRSTFDSENVKQYDYLLSQAHALFELDFAKPSEEAFWAAGRYIVEHCDVLIAIWDGEAAKGLGGTGDVVEYARTSGVPVIHIDPIKSKLHSYS